MRAMRLAPPVPTLWTVLCRDWLSLEPGLSRSWWFALAHARWGQAVEWREQFLAFDRQTGMVTREFIFNFFEETATLRQLMPLVAALMQEGTLLRRDGKRLEEALLSAADAAGHWKHLHERSRRAV
jgi:hypothetical protein